MHHTEKNSINEICQKFAETVLASGLETKARFFPNADDPFPTRFHVEGDKQRTKNGWYRLYIGHDNSFGIFGTWKSPYESHKWSLKSETEMTQEEIDSFRNEMKQLERKFEGDREKRYLEVAEKAQRILNNAKPATDDFDYLINKGVKAYGIFVETLTDEMKNDLGKEERLIIPMQDIEGRIWNIQFISKSGRKFFLTGGRKKGCFFIIGNPHSKVIRECEGYSTSASVFENLGDCVITAMDCGNLLPVAHLIHARYPNTHIQIAGDNDAHRKDGNIGLIKAQEAAKAVGGTYIVPNFDALNPEEVKKEKLTDWNDLAMWCGPNEVRSQFGKIKIQHLKPMPLQRTLPPPEPFPTYVLGDILAPAINQIAEVIQAPIGICAQSVLAALALAVQGYANIEIDGRITPLSEFFLTIGATGERKSAVDSIVLRPHRAYQENLREAYEKEFPHWLAMNEAYESAKKDHLRKSKTYDEKKQLINAIGFPPSKPLDPLILIEEPTYEGLTKLLSTGQPSIGLFSAEGGRFIGGHGMNNDNLLKTASGLSELWDGNQVSRIRAGDKPSLLSGKRVSFHLMAQPGVAQQVLSNSLLYEQGLMSRCLITWPISTVGFRFYKEIDLIKTQDFQEYSSRIDEIFNTPLPLVKENINELSPRVIKLSNEAKALFIAFHDSVESQNGDGRQLNAIRGLANKAPEHALRLAGILALFKDIRCKEVSLEAMAAGIELAKYYLNEALRLHNSSTIDPYLVLAEKLLEWLHKHSKTEITLIEIYQYGPPQIRDQKTARKLMIILTEHNHASLLEGGLVFEGIHRKDAWRIVK